MTVDATRLLVLGATRQEQPATGYAIMRELTSWGVQDWASVNPGSVYGALRAFVKDGLIVEDDTAAATGRTHRNSTKFRLTAEGQSTFTDSLRSALWDVTAYVPAPFMAALCFLVDLSRDEVVAAIEERVRRLESQLRQFAFDERQTEADTNKKPPHSVEFVRLAAGRLHGELEFTRALQARVAGGAYEFVGDQDRR